MNQVQEFISNWGLSSPPSLSPTSAPQDRSHRNSADPENVGNEKNDNEEHPISHIPGLSHSLPEREILPEPWLPGDPLNFPAPSTGDPWQNWHRRVEDHDNELCRGWKDEIEKILIFAGLFSAAVTAFVVESFKWLEPPDDSVAVMALGQISLQIANLNLDTTSKPTTSLQSAAFTPPPFTPTASAIRINIFWFLSLVLSLGSVLVGVLCLQWLREFQRDATRYTYEQALIIRQTRYDGLLKWGVPEIVNVLPILLQLAVAMFLIGICDLLFQRNLMVGIIILIPVVGFLGFLVVTTALPCIQWITWDLKYRYWHTKGHPGHTIASELSTQCPYKSSQAWLFRKAFLNLTHTFERVFRRQKPLGLFSGFSDSSWVDLDLAYQKLSVCNEHLSANNSTGVSPWDPLLVRPWIWAYQHLTQSAEPVYDLFTCFSTRRASTMEAIIEGLRKEGMYDEARNHTSVIKIPHVEGGQDLASLTGRMTAIRQFSRSIKTHPDVRGEALKDLGCLKLICHCLPKQQVFHRLALETFLRLYNYEPLVGSYYTDHWKFGDNTEIPFSYLDPVAETRAIFTQQKLMTLGMLFNKQMVKADSHRILEIYKQLTPQSDETSQRYFLQNLEGWCFRPVNEWNGLSFDKRLELVSTIIRRQLPALVYRYEPDHQTRPYLSDYSRDLVQLGLATVIAQESRDGTLESAEFLWNELYRFTQGWMETEETRPILRHMQALQEKWGGTIMESPRSSLPRLLEKRLRTPQPPPPAPP